MEVGFVCTEAAEMRTGRSRGSSIEFERKGADKFIGGRNLQPSPDRSLWMNQGESVAGCNGRFGIATLPRAD